jgi:hypothetical protein
MAQAVTESLNGELTRVAVAETAVTDHSAMLKPAKVHRPHLLDEKFVWNCSFVALAIAYFPD